MRIECPYCGPRDLREFTYRGHAVAMHRPQGAEWSEDWNDYLHDRENPAGWTEELWYHGACGGWLVAERDTTTHAFRGTRKPAS